jgi:hypothetical protein
MTACTCDACGREFTGVGPFDRHQRLDYTRRPAVRCLDPATRGMELNEHGRWGFPADAAARARLAQIRAERAARVVLDTPGDSEAAETRTEP